MKFMIFVKSNPDLEMLIDKMGDAEMKDSMAKMRGMLFISLLLTQS